MHRTEKISVIIPAYNEENYIAECLAALIANVHNHLHEIIVVDNNSTDSTARIAETFPGVCVVRELHQGTNWARECGYRYATGDILVYIDADTRPPAGWIERIQLAFARDPKLACLSGPFTHYDVSPLRRRLIGMWDVCSLPLYYAFGYMVIGGNCAIRKSVLDAMGGFNTNLTFYGDDADMGKRAKKYGKVIFWLEHTMPASARRLKAEGYAKTGMRYAVNFVWVELFGKALTHTHINVR